MGRSHVRSLTLSLIVSALAVSATACGTYRVVRRTPAGGEVALQGDQEKAREEATAYMAGQCPNGFDILEEGEAVIGSDSESQGQTTVGRNIFGAPTASNANRTSTVEKREWRVKYQCKTPGGAPGTDTPKAQAQARELIIRF